MNNAFENNPGNIDSTERLADFVCSTEYKDIPQEAVTVARNSLLDWLGVTIAGSIEPCIPVLCQYVKSVKAAEESTIIGCGMKTTPELAALVNGTMSHALDYDNTVASSVKFNDHASVTVFPPVLALAEQRELSGRQVLTAYIVGMEVIYRIGQAIGQQISRIGWHPTPILGTMGAVAASCKASNLNLTQVKMAFAIGSSLSGGIHKNVGTMVRQMHAGNASRNGIISAELAARGFIGDNNSLEGREGFCQLFSREADVLGNALGDLGEKWRLATYGLSFKPYPCCRITHAGIEASLELKKKYNPDCSQIAEIVCRASPFIHRLVEVEMPRTGCEGMFSAEFCIAIALLNGQVSLEHFTDDWIKDPRIQDLMAKVRIVHPDDLGTALVNLKTEVIIKLKNGEEYSQLVAIPRGEPENPMSHQEIMSKFYNCAARALHKEAAVRISNIVEHIEDTEDLHELFSLLSGAPITPAVSRHPTSFDSGK